MQKHFGVVVGVTMIGVAAVVVSQTGMMGSDSMKGQLIADYPISTSSSSEADANLESSTATNNVESSATSTLSESASSDANNQVDENDCYAIFEKATKACAEIKLQSLLKCEDKIGDCIENCGYYPWPFGKICNDQCYTDRSDCNTNAIYAEGDCVKLASKESDECYERKRNQNQSSAESDISSSLGQESSESSEATQGMSSSMDME